MAIKKCKGTGKAKGSGCGENKNIHKYGLCLDCFKNWVFGTPEGQQYFRMATLQGRKRAENENKKEKSKKKKEEKEAVEKKSELEKKLQKEFNSIIRIIDTGKGCISCRHGWRVKWTRQGHAGHWLSVGSNPQLRYNFNNCYLQCSICNNHKSSNSREYDKGIKRHYGQETLDKMQGLKKIKELHLTKEELRDFIVKIRDIKKEIMSGNDFSRDELNQKLGIYNF